MRPALLAVTLLLAPALGWAQEETEIDAEQCRTACVHAAERCSAEAALTTEECKNTVSAPCKVWCPCTQFIGAAYFNCQLKCETCEAETADPLAECSQTGETAAAECVRKRATCERDCGS
jgi:hypothetical protein